MSDCGCTLTTFCAASLELRAAALALSCEHDGLGQVAAGLREFVVHRQAAGLGRKAPFTAAQREQRRRASAGRGKR